MVPTPTKSIFMDFLVQSELVSDQQFQRYQIFQSLLLFFFFFIFFILKDNIGIGVQVLPMLMLVK
jgi:hypothetical protein